MENNHGSLSNQYMSTQEAGMNHNCCGMPITDRYSLVEHFETHHVFDVDQNQFRAQLPPRSPFPPSTSTSATSTTPNGNGVPRQNSNSSLAGVVDPSCPNLSSTSLVSPIRFVRENDDTRGNAIFVPDPDIELEMEHKSEPENTAELERTMDWALQTMAAVNGYSRYNYTSGTEDTIGSDRKGRNAARSTENVVHLGLSFGSTNIDDNAGDMNASMGGQMKAEPITSTGISSRDTPTKSRPRTPGISSSASSTAFDRGLSNAPELPITYYHPSSSLAPSRPFKCPTPLCARAFKTIKGLTHHVSYGPCPIMPLPEAAERRRKPFYCQVRPCTKRFKGLNGLMHHYQHSGEHGTIGLRMLESVRDDATSSQRMERDDENRASEDRLRGGENEGAEVGRGRKEEGGAGKTGNASTIVNFPDSTVIEQLLQAEEGILRKFVDVVQLVMKRGDTHHSRILDRFLRATAEKRGILPSSVFLNGVRRIGSNFVHGGGFSDVWMGEYEGRSIALKVLRIFDSKDREKMQLEFSKEAHLWRKLDHPNILPFLGICRDIFAPQMALVSHWMEKGSLVNFLKQHPQADCSRLVTGVACGLEYLHSLKPQIIHGDLRAANVLVDENDNPLITDFGLSKAIDSQGTLTASSFKGKGTLRWQAPELLNATRFGEGLSVPTTKSDVYAFSCLCLEVFTGKAPFAGLPDGNVILEVAVHDRRPPWPGTAAALKGLNGQTWFIMQLCWETKPSDRPEMSFVVSRLKKAIC